MKTMAITEIKSHALQVLGDVAARKERVVVTKRGKPLAEVVPYTEEKPTAGHLAEALVFEKDIVSPLGETEYVGRMQMKYLLDTHAWVWWNMAPKKLSRKARAAIENANHYSAILVSAISPWEFCKILEKWA